MKPRASSSRIAPVTTGVLLLAASARAVVYENAQEFSAEGDFDGDGRQDVVLVDKATGVFRVGYRTISGDFNWPGAEASGIETTTGFSVGHLLTTTTDALAFTASAANRVNVVDVSTPGATAVPTAVYPGGVGPGAVVAIDIGGVGNTPLDDLFVGSLWNGSVSPNVADLVRNSAGTFSEISGSLLPSPPARANRLSLKTGGPIVAGLLFRGTLNDGFTGFDLGSGSLVVRINATGLPPGADYVWAAFDTNSVYSQLLVYRPGTSNLTVLTVQEPVPGTFQFSAPVTFAFAQPVLQVFALPTGLETRLLFLFGDGSAGGVYRFDGLNAPALVQALSAPAGERLTGAAALGSGGFMAFSGDPVTRRSAHFQPWSLSGGSYVAGPLRSLPSVNAQLRRANVLLFHNEPFVAPFPQLQRTLNAGDWSSDPTIGGAPPVIRITTETFGGSVNGLGNPAPASLGPAEPLEQFGLVNQYGPAISVASRMPALGDTVAEVAITPPPGNYGVGVKIALTPVNPPDPVWYRLASTGSWQAYATPFFLFKDTTVDYYVQPAGGAPRSAIHSATYHFTVPPGQLDSDRDGVPDFVEIAFGLDPLKSGSDADSDGFPDLDELVSGTDPANSLSHPPTNHIRPDLHASFDLITTPRPLDGTTGGSSLATTGAVLHVFDLQGSLLGSGSVADGLATYGVTNPAALIADLGLDTQQRLLVLATEPHFDIATASADKRIGRELVGLQPVPALSQPFDVAYSYGGGDLMTEALAWVAAASNAVHSASRPFLTRDLAIEDTLVALLTELKLGTILAARGNPVGTNFTVLSFRPADSGRVIADQGTLLGLESQMDVAHPGYRLQDVFLDLDTAVKHPATAGVSNLVHLTHEIYRLSSASNNVTETCSTCPVFPSPVDTLRDFLETGILQSNYLAAAVLGAGELSGADGAVDALLAAVPGRPTTNIVLRVRSDSFSGPCSTLDTTSGPPVPKNLFHPGGIPFRPPDSFELEAGSLVSVFGYTDVSTADCPGDGIEVIQVALSGVPLESNTSTNGTLLYDNWLMVFGGDPYGDSDGDGYSNLQEMFDGTDPNNPSSHSLLPPVSLLPPEVHLDLTSSTTLTLRWTWPAAYAGRVRFAILSSDSLGGAFGTEPVAPVSLGGGDFEVILPVSGAGERFYEIQLTVL